MTSDTFLWKLLSYYYSLILCHRNTT